MNELTLTWQEFRQIKTHIIYDQQASKNPGTVRIGRDPARCDIVLNDPTLTVSGLHVEIFFHPQHNSFYLRCLRPSNPPFVDGHSIIQGEVPLRQGSTIHLGQMVLTVSAVFLEGSGVPATIVAPQHLPRVASQPPAPPQQVPRVVSQPPAPPQILRAPTKPPVPVAQNYGLQCPKCSRTSPYSLLESGCPWCGTSLAAAVSVLVTPSGL